MLSTVGNLNEQHMAAWNQRRDGETRAMRAVDSDIINLPPCEYPTPVAGTWFAQHGIASCITVVCPDGEQWTAIGWYNGAHWHKRADLSRETETPPLPQEVTDFVRRRFDMVSSMTIAQRVEHCTHRNWYVIIPTVKADA